MKFAQAADPEAVRSAVDAAGFKGSEITTFGRSANGIADASALTPADSEVVTATSSGAAFSRRANAPRAASVRSTQ